MAIVRRSGENSIIKSPNDRRSYRLIQLSNGLCAVLVHDPEIYANGDPMDEDGDEVDEEEDEEFEDDDEEDEDDDEDDEEDEEEDEKDEEKGKKGSAPTKKAAAAMCVGMGSFSDPFKAQGLAHFLEHMLFMGSSGFPDENEYDSFLSKHGGSSNAYTETEYTCYHFDVNREYLRGALERFSQFFISPLMKIEAMDREVLAVDSEFNQVLQNDSCRLQQLQCHTSSATHPFNRFFWGNKKSLIDAMESGVNLREEILKLYNDNYHGGNMKLILIGGEPLDTLEGWVVELFDNVKAGLPLKMNYTAAMPIWPVGKIYWLEAVKDVHNLEITWTLPSLHNEYLKKPEGYLAHLMGHEGRGSLLYFLKDKGWATSLSAGVGDDGMQRSSLAYIFVISISLTDSGLDKLYEVIGYVYQYIKLFRESTPQEWVFKELQEIGELDFRFAEEQPQDDYAAELAEHMLFYTEEHLIYGEYAFEQWDPKLVGHILSFFTPGNMRIDLMTKSFNKNSAAAAIKHEPWFGSRYIEEDISPPLLKLWADPPEISPELHFPLKNEFIPSDFSLRNAFISKEPNDANHPKCIVDQPLIKLWYKIDLTFNVPRANTYFLITVKDGYSSVKNSVLTELFLKLLKDELNEILYQAGVAKLDTSISNVGSKLVLKLSGFNDKLSVLLSEVLKLSKSFLPNSSRFKVIKEDIERSYRNANMKPLNHSTYLRLQVLSQSFWDVDDQLDCLVNLTVSDLEAFIPTLLSQLYIEGLCHGNLSEEEAINLSKIFTSMFLAQPLPADHQHRERVLCLPSQCSLIRSVRAKNELEVNSVVELYFQIEQDLGIEATRLRAITDLFGDIIYEPCFNQLRTKEQLGYVVECGPRMTYRIIGFCFRVQSSKFSPFYLHTRINNFIGGIRKFLDELDDASFESHRSGLIAQKLEKYPSLSYETGNLWTQIVDRRYLFDIYKMEAEELKMIKKDDVVNWFETYLRPTSSKCRQLAIHVWGCNTDINSETESSKAFGEIINNPDLFKQSSKFYPSLC